MKNLRIFLVILIATLSVHSRASQHTITIRPARLDDMAAITALSTHEYTTHFKDLWLKKYSPHIKLEQDIDTFIQEKIDNQKNANISFIERHAQQEEYCVLVACVHTTQNTEQIAGYCRFQKERADRVYMNYLLVGELYRKQGIAKQLAQRAMAHFPGMTECKFRTFIHDATLNEIYQKHNCKQVSAIALDPNTGRVLTDPHAPLTHTEYLFTIEK